jgi:hypothetical protein
MPTLKHLIQELRKIDVDPGKAASQPLFTMIFLTRPKTLPKRTRLATKRRIETCSPRISPAGGLFRVKGVERYTLRLC